MQTTNNQVETDATTSEAKTKEGYKKTKIGWIPEEWKFYSIKSFAKVYTGSTPKTDNVENYGDEYLFVSPADLGITKDITNTTKKLSKIGFENSRQFKKGSVLFTCIGSTIGKTGIATIDLTSNQQINAIQPSEKHNNDFLYYILIFISPRIKKLAGEQAVPIINKSEFESNCVPLPPLPEQRKIAEILSTRDKAIGQCQKLVEQLKTRKKGLMQQLLTGKTRLKGFNGEWKEVKIGRIFSEVKSLNDGNYHEPLTISARLGFVSQKDKFDRVIAGGSLDKYVQLQKDDFSYNKGNSKLYEMGCIYLLEEYDSAVVPFVYISFRKQNQSVYNQFYKHWFSNHGLDQQLKAIITSGARGDGLLNVSKKDFFSLKVPFPSLEEQTAIAQVLTAADNEIKTQENYLAQLQAQKKGLMQQLLTGQKRVKV